MSQSEPTKQYQDPAKFIEQLTSDINIIKPSRYFYREVSETAFDLYFNPNIEADPDGVNAAKLLTLNSKFTAYSLVTSLNVVLLNGRHEFANSVARQQRYIKNKQNKTKA